MKSSFFRLKALKLCSLKPKADIFHTCKPHPECDEIFYATNLKIRFERNTNCQIMHACEF